MLNLNIEYPNEVEFWQNWFTSTIVDTTAWSSSADDLARVLTLLTPQIDSFWESLGTGEFGPLGDGFRIQGVYLMLAAYALENYFKGALVAMYKWSAADIKAKLPSELKSHDLKSLAEPLKLPLSVEEIDLLERLSAYSTWAGRYPVPLFREGLKPVKDGINIGNQLTIFRGSDTAVVASLLEKLAGFLNHGHYEQKERKRRPFDEHTMQTNVRGVPA